ncbi:MAG: PEP-CTERM sorting domain-containing protein [Aquabacterium sp.]|uniref:PEP-CTERM sorting domain-containing protein n=1 Tax=Aquabacterium sp. TaxID=1872578 RepID=UPI0025C6D8B4|nr:PEP-CTERM sorting domain-containing protein [Aquabacterium sp.]MBI5925774.1 PEP-CTERM sorting domain-containing protein [Aquabacterium sp.]
MNVRFSLSSALASGVAILSTLASTAACAASATVSLDGASYLSATNGSGTISAAGSSQSMWTTGDYVTKAFTTSGLSSVTSLEASINIHNMLGTYNGTTGTDLQINVLLNGSLLGSLNALACGYYCNENQTLHFSSSAFAPIVGNDAYTVTFALGNTIPQGEGSIRFFGDSSITVAGAVPEPGTYGLLFAGVLGLGLSSRKFRQGLAGKR